MINSELAIRDKDIKATIQLSAQRKIVYKNFYDASEKVTSKIPVTSVDVCRRAFTIFETPEYNVIGNIARGESTVTWNPEVCGRLGLQILE